MIKQLIINDWKKAKRSAPFKKNVLAAILLTFCVLYMVAMFLGCSFFLAYQWDDISKGEGLSLFFKFTLYYFALLFIIRLFVQQMPDNTIHYYRLLPIPKRTLINYSLSKSIINVWLILSLVFFIPFGIMRIIPEYGVSSFIGWILGMIAIELFVNYLVVLTKRSLDGNIKIFFIIIAGVLSIAALDYFNIISIGNAFAKSILFSLKYPVLWITYFIPAFLIYYANYQYFNNSFYISGQSKKPNFEFRKKSRIEGNNFGKTWTYVLLEFKLLLRNKQLRRGFIGILFIDVMIASSLGHPESAALYDDLWLYLMVAYPALFYLVYAFSSESPYWDLIITLNISPKKYVSAKIIIAFALTIIQSIFIVILCIIYPFITRDILAISIYNIGFSIPLMVFIATYNTKRINMGERKSLNSQGMDFYHAIIIWLFMFIPPLINIFDRIEIAPNLSDYIFAGLGIIGLLLYPLWIKMSAGNLKERKYKMAESFRIKN